MVKKTLTFMIASVLAIVLFLGMASATLTTSAMPTLSQDGSNFTFELTSDNATTQNVKITIADIVSDGKTITFDDQDVVFTTNNTKPVIITYSVEVGFDFELGNTYSQTMTINDLANSVETTETISFEETDFCEDCANEGDLRINDVNINVDGFGDEDVYWYLFDEIEVELEIENRGDWDIDNIEVEWELYNTDGKKIMDGNENDFNLKDGDDTIITFMFVLDEDIDDFEKEDAVLYIRAKGEIDDRNSAFDGNDTCDSELVEVDVRTDEKFVIPADLKINGVAVKDLYEKTLSCGQEITITGKVWNIGDNDQDDVTLDIYNEGLGILERIQFSQVDAFDSEGFSYTFVINKDSEEKVHYISFEVFDEDNDIYENDENDESSKLIGIKVDNCMISEPLVTASLDSEAKAGNEMIMVVTLTNLDAEQVTFDLDAEGYASWAELISVDPKIVVLAPGESKDIKFIFDLERDAEGDYTFNLVASNNGEVVQSQSVMVGIEKSSFSLNSLVDGFNWKLGLIILINLILVIAIIVVAVRIKRK